VRSDVARRRAVLPRWAFAVSRSLRVRRVDEELNSAISIAISFAIAIEACAVRNANSAQRIRDGSRIDT